MSQLALYDVAREALSEARRVDEVLSVRNKAEQAKLYARQSRDRHMLADASEIVARAERRLGQILREMKASGQISSGGRPAKADPAPEPETGDKAEPVFDQKVTLEELEISKKLSSAAQRLAEDYADDEAFEAELQRRREMAMADGATIIRPVKNLATPNPEKVGPLPARRFHQFAFGLIAMSMRGLSVSNASIHSLAEGTDILTVDGDVLDFTPAALVAFGSLADTAMKAIEGDTDPDPEAIQPATAPSSTVQRPTEAAHVASVASREIGDVGGGTRAFPAVETLQSEPAPLSTVEADAVIRAGYARGDSVAALADQVGRPGNKAYVRNRARVMGISSRERQRKAASAFATAQHAVRRADSGRPRPEQEP